MRQTQSCNIALQQYTRGNGRLRGVRKQGHGHHAAMKKTLTLKKSFIFSLAVLTILSLLVLGAVRHLTHSIDHLKAIEAKRYQATQLATEYKNLPQAMSRDVMAFVSSE